MAFPCSRRPVAQFVPRWCIGYVSLTLLHLCELYLIWRELYFQSGELYFQVGELYFSGRELYCHGRELYF